MFKCKYCGLQLWRDDGYCHKCAILQVKRQKAELRSLNARVDALSKDSKKELLSRLEMLTKENNALRNKYFTLRRNVIRDARSLVADFMDKGTDEPA